MASMTVKKHVEAPPERVFAAATDFQNLPKFIRGIKKVEMLTDGPVGAGARFRETRTVFKREATEEMQVTAFEPPRRVALGCESCGCRYHTEFTFTPAGNGTDVRMTFEAQPLSLFAKVMSVLMKPMIKACLRESEKDLDDVKAAVESGRWAATRVA